MERNKKESVRGEISKRRRREENVYKEGNAHTDIDYIHSHIPAQTHTLMKTYRHRQGHT